MAKGFGITALIFGSICIPLSSALAALGSMFELLLPDIGPLISLIGWLIAAIAIIFGIVGIIKDDTKGMAITGLILGILGLIAGFVIRYLLSTLFSGFL